MEKDSEIVTPIQKSKLKWLKWISVKVHCDIQILQRFWGDAKYKGKKELL